MKIITYNLNYRKNLAGQWAEIAKFGADIMLLQELRPPETWCSAVLGSGCEGRFIWTRMNDGWGSAVYLKERHGQRIDVPGCQGWAVGVELAAVHPANFLTTPLRFFCVHVANKPYLDTALKVLTAIENLGEADNLVIGGDFNRTVGIQGTDRGGLITGDESRQIIEFMRRRLGLMSAWQAANPNTKLAQTLRVSNSPKKFHCDGIFVPASWYRYLDSCEVPQGGPWLTLSDHNPVVASFAES